MVVAIYENVSTLTQQGRSLDEAIAAKPTADFVITPAFFTKLVYEGV
jgi:hypothetical protein